MLLFDQFLGYNFMGVRQYPNMLFEINLANPKDCRRSISVLAA
jgi:hypothetical protein